MSLSSNPTASPAVRKRFLLLSLAAIGIFLLLMLRLWYLQVVSTERYRELSEQNRIRYIPIAAPRGAIYDRDGELLVDNRPSFDISVLRQEVQDRELLLDRLSAYLGVDAGELRKRWANGSRFPKYRPLPLAEDITLDQLEQIQENAVVLPGVLAEVRPLRSYPNGEMGAHLFGYLGEITERELQKDEEDFYRQGDFVGKSGLELKLEKYLRGISGERRVEVDVLGKELRLLKTQEPVPGSRVYLTLKKDLQLAAEAAFGEEAGAAVALDVHTGEILAMASRPSFNPADFARGISGKQWVSLLQNPRHPLENKAIKGQYPPGSTFKIVTALAALKAGVTNPTRTVYCGGKFHLGSRAFRCWKRGGHGTVDLNKALRESCDVYFYQVGLEMGIDRLAQMSVNLGLGSPLGVPLEGEKAGLIPSREWKRKRFSERWYDGETVIAAIGQGYVLTTPLQLAVMTASVANGGKVLRPHVVKRVEDLEGRLLMETTPELIHSIGLHPPDLEAVRRGLVSVVNEGGGTARVAQLPGITVAGKTGTAQVVRLKEDRNKDEASIPYRFRDHALFVAYAPAEDPRIAVAVVVEHGMHGGSAAAPVARAILASYFGIPTPAPQVIAEGALPASAPPGSPAPAVPAAPGEPAPAAPAPGGAAAPQVPQAGEPVGD